MKTRIGTVTAMTLCMGVMPLTVTLIIAKVSGRLTESWMPDEFGVVFALIHFALFIFGAWLYATKVGN